MFLAIAGGALQGLEVTYLARKAGYETLLLDKSEDAVATGICHRFVSLDLTDHGALSETLESVDMVLPATENVHALRSLVRWCRENNKPLAFDPEAYAISSSKAESDHLFRRMKLPVPTPWPECGFPVLAKPDTGSGSHGVEVIPDSAALEERFGPFPTSGWVLQEYLNGPSFSVEVMGIPGAYTPFQVTDLQMDRSHDCKRVTAPTTLPVHSAREFETMAVALAEAVRLRGIMDVEIVVHEGQLNVLEIDARFPSQTPTAVFHSTGINMVERLVALFAPDAGLDSHPDPGQRTDARGFVLEHLRFRRGKLSVEGEGMIRTAGPLRLVEDFFGSDEALTSHSHNKDEWVATLMVQGKDLPTARTRRDKILEEMRIRLGVNEFSDEYPQDLLGRVK